MLDVISVANMKDSDNATIAHRTSSRDLMHNAAMGIFDAVNSWDGHTSIITGKGNNGGDGFALACILVDKGHSCSVHMIEPPSTPDAIHYMEQAQIRGIEICQFEEECESLLHANTVVDCIFGTGFRGEAYGTYAEAIDFINFCDSYVVSADINSGLNADTGNAITAVKSDLTVSVGYLKNGMFLQRASRFIDKLVNVNAGIELARKENVILPEEEFDKMVESLPKEPMCIDESNLLGESLGEDDLKKIAMDGRESDCENSICVAGYLSDMLNTPILINGKSCDVLVFDKNVTFKKPEWLSWQ